MAKYNGHKNYNHWNVHLWLTSDEGLYNTMLYFLRRSDTRHEASSDMLEYLYAAGYTRTPDGAPYTETSIRAAMRGH